MRKFKEEIKAMQKFNEKNPERQVTMIIDNFENTYWFERDGKRLDLSEEHEIIMCD